MLPKMIFFLSLVYWIGLLCALSSPWMLSHMPVSSSLISNWWRESDNGRMGESLHASLLPGSVKPLISSQPGLYKKKTKAKFHIGLQRAWHWTQGIYIMYYEDGHFYAFVYAGDDKDRAKH